MAAKANGLDRSATARPAVLRLSAADNVAVALRALAVGEPVSIDGTALVVAEPIELGHKLATEVIPEGAKIVKFGMPIGAATKAIAPGAWVHIHNIRSLWLTNDKDQFTSEASE
jgi:altronate dehydratase small subunit